MSAMGHHLPSFSTEANGHYGVIFGLGERRLTRRKRTASLGPAMIDGTSFWLNLADKRLGSAPSTK
jgi:hypothetical protein